MDSSARSWDSDSALRQPTSLWETMRAAWSNLAAAPRVEPLAEGSQRVLRLVGALDRRVAAEVKAQSKAFADGDGTSWAIDLTDVNAWDSEGLSALVYALDVSDLAGKQLTLLDPSPALRHTLERSQLHHLFQIHLRDA